MRGVLVQTPHEPEQRFLRGAGVEAMLEGSHSRLSGLSHLVAHIDLARRVFADQHHRESGGNRVHVHAGARPAGATGRAGPRRRPCRR